MYDGFVQRGERRQTAAAWLRSDVSHSNECNSADKIQATALRKHKRRIIGREPPLSSLKQIFRTGGNAPI